MRQRTQVWFGIIPPPILTSWVTHTHTHTHTPRCMSKNMSRRIHIEPTKVLPLRRNLECDWGLMVWGKSWGTFYFSELYENFSLSIYPYIICQAKHTFKIRFKKNKVWLFPLENLQKCWLVSLKAELKTALFRTQNSSLSHSYIWWPWGEGGPYGDAVGSGGACGQLEVNFISFVTYNSTFT